MKKGLLKVLSIISLILGSVALFLAFLMGKRVPEIELDVDGAENDLNQAESEFDKIVYTGKKSIESKDLEIKEVHDDYKGISYSIFTKDKSNSFTFPAYCLALFREQETIRIGDMEFDKAEVEEMMKGLKPVN